MPTALVPLARSPRSERVKRRAIRALLGTTLRGAYRLRVRGMHHVPRRGPAVVVCNHVSFIDWLFVALALPRLPHFVMHQHHFRSAAFRWFFDLHHVIPIAPRKEDPARCDEAFEAIDRALAAGELVMIFPEGTMTPDGELSPIRPGVERILARRPVPVVPLALRGLWGSFFSRDGGEPMQKLPRRLRSSVEIVAGAPIPPGEVTTERLASTLAALRGVARR
ncbi:MAG: 1-acyl-sn-glycerol-3-phosphate acyltransferase [Myxococcales bacterium]|nr:1-acyl-sn-glycerol-3-phosphate acyltransferase [Myxococcales bacterium]